MESRMTNMQLELDSVRQDLAEHHARLREVRAELKDARASGNVQHWTQLQQENVALLELITKLQDKKNRLSSQLEPAHTATPMPAAPPPAAPPPAAGAADAESLWEVMKRIYGVHKLTTVLDSIAAWQKAMSCPASAGSHCPPEQKQPLLTTAQHNKTHND